MTEPYFNISNATTNASVNQYEDYTSYINDVERLVSISVFFLFSFIFVAGLIGNGLVVMGKRLVLS